MTPEMNIQSLLDRIKTEGLEEARRASEEILKDARSRASAILTQAREEAEDIRDKARAEIQRDRESFEAAMSQAGRNLMVGLRQQIVQLCNHILQRNVRSALEPELIREMILKMVAPLRDQEGIEEVEVILNESDLQKVEELLLGSLQGDFKEGVFLKPVESVQAGFRIGEKGGSMHYDLTDKGLAEILGGYLSPRIARFLDEASREGGSG